MFKPLDAVPALDGVLDDAQDARIENPEALSKSFRRQLQ